MRVLRVFHQHHGSSSQSGMEHSNDGPTAGTNMHLWLKITLHCAFHMLQKPKLFGGTDSSFTVRVDPKLYSYVGCVCVDSSSEAVSKVDSLGEIPVQFSSCAVALLMFATCICCKRHFDPNLCLAPGNRYLAAVPKKGAAWRQTVIILSVVIGALLIAAALFTWQYPRLRREFAQWQLQILKSR